MKDSLLSNRQGKAKGKDPLGTRASIISKSGNLCSSALRPLGQRLTFLPAQKVLLASGHVLGYCASVLIDPTGHFPILF